MNNNQSNFPRVTEILQTVGLIDMSKINPAVLIAAQKFGIAVHRACELWDKNNLNVEKLSPEIVPYLNSWKKYLEQNNIKYSLEEVEKRLYSTKLMFTGKPDRFCFVGNTLHITDIKVSNVIYPATSIQLAAYEILILENFPKKCYVKRKSVLLSQDGYKIVEHKNPADKTIFLSALNIYNWRKNNLWV